MKKLLFIIAILAIGLVSCRKRGPQGIQGEDGDPGVEGTNLERLITFSPGDQDQLFGEFNDFEMNDVIITYVKYGEINGSYLWTQIPYSSATYGIHFVPFFSESTGKLWIGAQRIDGGVGSPVMSTTSIYFRAVHIKAFNLINNPNVDYSNYEEVVKTFDLTN